MVSLRHLSILLSLALIIGTGCKKGDGEDVEDKPPIKTEEDRPCENTCVFAYDGACDDGGPDAKFSYCDFGTDCADCGKRNVLTVKN